MNLTKHFVLLVLVSSFSQSWAGTKPDLEDFDKIALKMRKTEVIEYLGSPYTSFRDSGKDRWIYHFYKNRGEKVVNQEVREIHFESGEVSYKGTPLKAKISAEEQDKINLQKDLEELDKWEKHKKKAVDAREEYRQWVLERRNKHDDPDAYVPQFKPVT